MKASDIMTRNVVTISSSATVAEAMRLMKERDGRSLIVERDDEQDAYGIITETDIVYKVITLGSDPDHVYVHEVMTKPCIVINPDLSVENVARLFINNRLLRAPVIQGTLLGIVSISDILVKSHLGEKLHQKISDQDLRQRVRRARTTYAEEGSRPGKSIETWDTFEDQLADLSQHHAEIVLKAALEDYFEEFETLNDPKTLDNLCSG